MGTPLFGNKSLTKSGRLHERFRLGPLHKISVQWVKEDLDYKASNISITGIGLFLGGREGAPIGGKVSAEIRIDQSKFIVELEVVHKIDEVMGCKFQNSTEEMKESIKNYFSKELAVLKLSKVETRKLEESTEKTLFFHGLNNCELLVREKDENLQHFSLILFGNYIEGSSEGINVIGEKISNFDTTTSIKGVSLFKTIQYLDFHLLESAAKFIEGIEGLSPKKQRWILAALKKQSRLKNE